MPPTHSESYVMAINVKLIGQAKELDEIPSDLLQDVADVIDTAPVEKTFYEMFMTGVDFELVHDCVQAWNMVGHDVPLCEYLGLLPSEYQMLVDNEPKFQRYLELVRESHRTE